jgi:multidrug efflux pump subunit AcrA (membrane-fusion protein)
MPPVGGHSFTRLRIGSLASRQPGAQERGFATPFGAEENCMRASSRLVLLLAAVALAVVAVTWVFVARRPAEVAVLEIRPQTVEQALSVVGRARPMQLIQVASPNSGQVIRLFHDEGARVAAGDPLAVILATVEQAPAARGEKAVRTSKASDARPAAAHEALILD